MNSVRHDWTWSDKYRHKVFEIVGKHLLTTAPLEVDRNEATDFVLKVANAQIACRIRRYPSNPKYLGEFTLRSARSSGAKAEFEKIVDGWADWMFYGFATQSGEIQFARWSLIDLHSFRAHLIRNPDRIRRGEIPNHDGTWFYWFDLSSFPRQPNILIASGSA